MAGTGGDEEVVDHGVRVGGRCLYRLLVLQVWPALVVIGGVDHGVRVGGRCLYRLLVLQVWPALVVIGGVDHGVRVGKGAVCIVCLFYRCGQHWW